MEKIYRNRSIIAKITLASILLTLFIALNYKIWGVIYSEGSFEEGIIVNTESIKQCAIEQKSSMFSNQNLSNMLQCLSDLIVGAVEVSIDLALMSFIIYLTKGSIYIKVDKTLVSLCVRMDN